MTRVCAQPRHRLLCSIGTRCSWRIDALKDEAKQPLHLWNVPEGLPSWVEHTYASGRKFLTKKPRESRPWRVVAETRPERIYTVRKQHSVSESPALRMPQ